MTVEPPASGTAAIGGNLYPKYHTRNPIARWLVASFIKSFQELTARSGAREVLEIGCGEGYLSTLVAANGRRVRGVDVSPAVIEIARRNATPTTGELRFDVASLFEMDPERDSAELVVCCEVLEHLEEWEKALGILASLARPYLLVSVPREPIWRVLNIARGKYLSELGNTPGHVQHWSRSAFLGVVERYVKVLEVRTPLPWTMALCRARGSNA